MKKYGTAVVAGFMALLIGWVLSVQMQTTDGRDQGGLVPLVQLRHYQEELRVLRGEREDVLRELMALEELMNAIEMEKAAEDALIRNMLSDLERYRMASGIVDVHGPGVVITIRDSAWIDEYMEDFNSILFNSDQLLSLVNRLREAGAEAISINGQRIVGTTEISLAGRSININGVATASPYTVMAIGNPETIVAALTIRGGVIDTMRRHHNWIVDISQREDVSIARYTGVVSFRNARPVAFDGDG